MPDTAWGLPFSSWVAGWDWPSANILERRDLRTFTSDPFLSYARNSKLLAKIKSLKALRAQKILARRSRKSSKNGRWHDTAHSKTLMNRKVNGTVSHSSQLILWMAVEICEEFRGRSSIELSGTSTATEAAHRGRRRCLAERVHRRRPSPRRFRSARPGDGDLRDRDHVGSLRSLPRCRHGSDRGSRPSASVAAAWSLAASAMCIRTGRRRTTRCSARVGQVPNSSSGPRSRRPPRTP